ncbi:MAG: winged helix-turn-helix transcriptional regulator [Acidobacteria bacterium]|nr:winged helix-turn-helix transcriptional regulator [Acidobacteriota bacterium]
MKELDKILKALADPSRLRILNILFEQETCVCDIQLVLGLPQPLLSRHLAYLRSAGIVRDRRDGPRVYYSLALDDELGQAVREFLQKALPLFETFQMDSAKMREFTQCCGEPKALRKSNRPAGRQSKEVMNYAG